VPERAALVLRSLVFGSLHPGMATPQALTAEEIAAILLFGVAVETPREPRAVPKPEKSPKRQASPKPQTSRKAQTSRKGRR
jgi:hypothetical protein